MHFRTLGLEKSTLLIACLYVVLLGMDSKLDLYIHPRYILFTIILAATGLVILLADTAATSDKHGHEHVRFSSLIPLYILLSAALLLPAKSLSSATVSQRSIDSGSVVTTASSQPLHTLFAGSSRGLKLADWTRLLQTNTDPTYYVNKPAKISGFIYDAGLGPDTVWLARFILTCCAVDAQPVGVPVHIPGWQDQYAQDQWVEVEGAFTASSTSDTAQLVLEPETITAIEEPDNPYAN